MFFSVASCHLSLWVQCCSFGACGDILEDPSWTYSVWSPCRDFLRRETEQNLNAPLMRWIMIVELHLIFYLHGWTLHIIQCLNCYQLHCAVKIPATLLKQ